MITTMMLAMTFMQGPVRMDGQVVTLGGVLDAVKGARSSLAVAEVAIIEQGTHHTGTVRTRIEEADRTLRAVELDLAYLMAEQHFEMLRIRAIALTAKAEEKAKATNVPCPQGYFKTDNETCSKFEGGIITSTVKIPVTKKKPGRKP